MRSLLAKESSVPLPAIFGLVLVSFLLTETATLLLGNMILAVMGIFWYVPVVIVSVLYPQKALPANIFIGLAYLGMAFFLIESLPVAIVTIVMQFFLYISIGVVSASLVGMSKYGGVGYHDYFLQIPYPACIVDLKTHGILEANTRFAETFLEPSKSFPLPDFSILFPSLHHEDLPSWDDPVQPEQKKILAKTRDGDRKFIVEFSKDSHENRIFITFTDISETDCRCVEEEARTIRHEIISRIVTTPWDDRDTLLKDTLHDCITRLGFDYGAIFLIKEKPRRRLRLECAENLSPALMTAVREIYPEESLIFPVYSEGTTFVIEDVFTRDPGLSQRHGIQSLAGMPIVARSKVVGSLVVATKNPHVFTAMEKSILSAVGIYLGNALDLLRIHKQLQIERENVMTLFNTMDEFVSVLGKDGTILAVNDAIVRRFGYTREELVGRSFFDLHGPENREELESAFFRILNRPSGDSRFCFYTRARLPVDVECRIREGRWNGRPVYFGISRDISGRIHDEMVINRRTAILEAVSFAADRFLKEPLHGSSWADEIPEVLEVLGQATGSGRICILENHPCKDNPDLPCTTLRFEWVREPFRSRIGDDALKEIRFPEIFPDAHKSLSDGKPVFLRVNELPFINDPSARLNGSLQLLNIPIMADTLWWGILTLEPQCMEHEWSRIEIDALMTAAGILGSAIHHRTMVEIYQNPVEHSLVGIFLLENGIIRYVNPRLCEIFGYLPGELAGKQFVPFLVAPQDRDFVDGHRQNKENGSEISSHYYFYGIRKDKEIITLENYSTRVDFQGKPGIIGTLMDITERTKAEEALRESENKFRILSEASPVGIFLVDQEGNFVYANDKWFSLTGLSRGNAAGTGWKSVIPPDYRDRFDNLCRDCISTGREVSEEIRFVHPDTAISWAYLRALPRRDKGGRITGYIGVIFDITDRKKYEEALRTALDEKSVLIMEIHHRVKNNLQIISGLIRLQSRYIINEQALRALHECENRVVTMALVHESLYQSGNLSNIDARRHISALAHNIIMSDELGTRITLDLDIEDISLDMNVAIPVSLIINELLVNSLKYAFSGRDHGTIRIALHKNAKTNMLVLTVSDDGVGIPPGINILESKSLGLKLVVRLARDQLNGDIAFMSENGTTFTMTIPDPRDNNHPSSGVN